MYVRQIIVLTLSFPYSSKVLQITRDIVHVVAGEVPSWGFEIASAFSNKLFCVTVNQSSLKGPRCRHIASPYV
jgi:hypothetical protein